MATRIEDAVARVLPNLAHLSDEDWARRDAEVAAARAREEARLEDLAMQRVLARLLMAGLSHRHVRAVLAGVGDTPAAHAVLRLRRPGIWVLSGNVGCGKTTAAHVWLMQPAASGKIDAGACGFVSAAQFARTTRYEDKLARWGEVPRLVVDDMGVEYADERGSFLVDLDELVDIRWRAGLATLLTTNLDAASFKARYGDRIADRVRDEGGWLNVSGPSMRGRGGR